MPEKNSSGIYAPEELLLFRRIFENALGSLPAAMRNSENASRIVPRLRRSFHSYAHPALPGLGSRLGIRPSGPTLVRASSFSFPFQYPSSREALKIFVFTGTFI